MADEASDALTETGLLDLARGGDRAALTKLLERHQQKVFSFGVKMCGDSEDAKDIAQDTLLTMARTVRDFRGEASLSTWLYTVARSFCIKKRRRTKGAPAYHEQLDQVTHEGAREPSMTPEQALLGREARETVASALDKLDPEAREVVVLRDVEGLSAAEVAEVTGVSVAAVKSRLHRARAALRTHLLEVVGGEPAVAAKPSCPDVLTMLSRKLEDEISPDVCAEMEVHVAGCAHCRGVCDSLKRTLDLCKALPTPTVPEHVQDSLRQAVASALGDARAEAESAEADESTK
jgi:RNA polymerase sigma-70 factor (ECF subfamily)